MTQSPATPLPSPKECRRLREAQDLTQAQVAAKVGVTRETVRSWETGRTTPRGSKRAAYARLLAAAPARTRPPGASSKGRSGASRTAKSTGTGKARGSKAASRSSTDARPAASDTDAPESRTAEAVALETATPEAVVPEAVAPDTVVPETAEPEPPESATDSARGARLTPDQAFDALYAFTSPALVRQTYLLTGRRALAKEAVERAFQQAWERWPEVAVDRDPVGWVRAAAYEYALSPWHRLRRRHRQPEAPPAEAEDRKLLDTLLSLPTPYRRTLVLYDGVGLDLPETAAETEASTPAAAHRLLHAREAVAGRLPELSEPTELQRRLDELARAEKLGAGPATVVRQGGEHRSRFWTRAAIAFTALIIGASALALATSPRQYEPVPAPGAPISGVPPRMGPGPLTEQDKWLRQKLQAEPGNGPQRLAPLLE
ncbi:helix-turn-helix domain-containing protein [Streptomyces sp. B-S-A8]|uniref:Helix-turn-helix domain-containing protein n=1 Tax=Streptomyces solicavernae TaxID=3043614 RepID=A0ABT6RMW7_9ACTN|nr:helix-turn-helix domain-containing protein [Streptomyces sp. B-S-A8]MDI3385665.1 helix-turn-helix domain-containing protein [Streptomyces sp. B-S-A8]